MKRRQFLQGAGVGLAAAVLIDQILLGFLGEGHGPPRLSSPEPPLGAPGRSTSGRDWVAGRVANSA